MKIMGFLAQLSLYGISDRINLFFMHGLFVGISKKCVLILLKPQLVLILYDYQSDVI